MNKVEKQKNKKKREKESRKNVSGFYLGAGMHKSKVQGRSGDHVLYGGAK